MCKDCGCSTSGAFTVHRENDHDHYVDGKKHSHGHHHHEHGHDHEHHHEHTETPRRTVAVLQSLLEKNDRIAEQNRGFLKAKRRFAINLLSSPGSGKTMLIEKTLEALSGKLAVSVIVGDLETDNDAQRIRGKGAEVIQVTTGTICHLDAEMVSRAMEALNLETPGVLIIENVGNLVCPAAYDLGETARVALLSSTEGEDKPLKYPPLFKSAEVVLITKMDMAEAAGFNRELAIKNIREVAPQARIIELSSKTGLGMPEWLTFLGA